ncbi:MAPEG family protein [Comamonadaceae bacterium G21597-S1]|nr:MAPEG family protein [Comamonadaceae bacterium G21597-S1]
MVFSLAHWCVLVASLLPIVCAGIAKYGRFGMRRSEGGFDNDDPRDWLARQTGWRARANAAQANSFEALPFFIGAVVIALQLGADPARVDWLATAFVLLRIVYVGLYVAGIATVRTVVWTLALVVNIAILFSARMV